jgi:hypothetical protein
MPQILSQPRSQITRENDPIILKVAADGIPAPRYQWTKDGRAVPGATDATYRVQSARTTDAGTYQVMIANEAGSIRSDSVGVAVEAVGVAPVIATPPFDLVVSETNASSLKVIASGTPPLAYQWTKDGRPENLSAEAECFIASPKVEDSGTYTVEVSNRWGRTTATCRLTVNPRPRRP